MLDNYIIRLAKQEDLQELLDIYNYEVVNGVATLDIQPKTLAQRQEWLDDHNKDNHPLIVCEIDGKIAGYASLSPYREKEAYKTTVELSVYVGKDYRRIGVAKMLMSEILDMARKDKTIYTVISVITSGNVASVKLHERFKFKFCGSIPDVAVKFGDFISIDNFMLSVR